MTRRLLVFLVLVGLLLPTLGMHQVYADTNTDTTDQTPLIVNGDYNEVLSAWDKLVFTDNSGFTATVKPSEFTPASNIVTASESNGYNDSVYKWDDNSNVTFTIMVSTEGLYHMAVDFYSLSPDYSDIELGIKINDKIQYAECSQIILYKQWEQVGGFSTDRYGNDFYGEQQQRYAWIHQDFLDPMGLFSEPLLFHLNAGANTIVLEKNKGDLMLGDVTVTGRKQLISYAEYAKGATLTSEAVLNTYEAEIPDIKNSPSIQADVSRAVGVTPFSVQKLKLNVLSGSTYNANRETVSYYVNVNTAGYYYITFKVQQNTVSNSNVYRTLRINGEIPFKEAASLPFFYNTSWQNVTLGGDTPYMFYLNAGKNLLSLSVDSSPYKDSYYTINSILDYVNNLSLDIKKLTGNQVDQNRDWNIQDYLPDVKTNLTTSADKLQVIFDYLQGLTDTTRLSEVGASLKIAIRNLQYLAEKPNEIPKNINLLSTSEQSIASTLGNTISLLLNSPLTIDKFYVHTDVELPAANGKAITNIWIGIERFVLSFFNNSYTQKAKQGELVVWVNRSKQYTDLIQKMADDTFTKETGISVQISVMSDENKLILANSAGTNPDVALGVSSFLPYNLGLRGAILNLAQYAGTPEFVNTINLYPKESLIPMMYDKGLYGLPDTENFYVLFYRSDIMNALGIPIPNTWDDVATIMPMLKRYDMNFYLPLSSAVSLKSFDSTLPFLFQYGSDVYQPNGFNVELDNTKSVLALQKMTELYTIYSLNPTVTSFYNEFRLALSPIGVADFGMYILLQNAAPDIKGLWKIAPMPGVMQTDGTVNRSAPGAQTANMIFKNTKMKAESWKFLQWWSSTKTQVQYENLLLSTLGTEYMWNSANTDAFKALNINPGDLNIILNQWADLRELPKVPGSYQVELEISNIWNAVVLNRENMRVLLNDAIISMDNEIHKKMAEFGYMDKQGNILQPYYLASTSTIDKWKAGDSSG
jgi:ABC-type glycerol-3-phosphate transport system substrate-binding protein/GTP cyclohydrolase III